MRATRYSTGKACRNGHLSERFPANKTCVQCEVERLAKWRVEFRDKRRVIVSRWDKANLPARAAMRRVYRARHPDRIKEQESRPEAKLAKRVRTTNRRLKMKAAGSFTRDDVNLLKIRQKGRCVYCQHSFGDAFHVDHILPLNLNGPNDRTNLQLLCEPCNLSKGAKHPIIFAQSKGLLL